MTETVLSPKQVEIVHWLSLGKTSDETAEIMGVSRFTTKSHIIKARYATCSATVASLVARALREGWIQ